MLLHRAFYSIQIIASLSLVPMQINPQYMAATAPAASTTATAVASGVSFGLGPRL